MKKTFLLVLFTLSYTLFSFAQEVKTISISPFTGVKVYSGIHVKLIPSDENKNAHWR